MGEVHAVQDGTRAVLSHLAARSGAQMGDENFPVALRFLPRHARADLARVYAFARFVDDVGDEAPGDRLQLLDVVEAELRDVHDAAPTLAPVAELKLVLAEHEIPIETPLHLIAANRVDQHTARYDSFDDLLAYCQLSAAPIGQMVLHIAGAATPANVADSDAVCAALQVLEHCQDVGEDARAGRVYLPGADLRPAGVGDAELLTAHTDPRVRQIVAVQVGRARDLLVAGRPLVGRLHGWARVAVAGFVAGGLATADALDAADFDVLGRTVRPSRVRTATHAVRLVGHRGRR
jgi:squalene synthase HpnC